MIYCDLCQHRLATVRREPAKGVYEYRCDKCKRVELHPVADPVGRNDPCPCASGKKAKRCCYS